MGILHPFFDTYFNRGLWDGKKFKEILLPFVRDKRTLV